MSDQTVQNAIFAGLGTFRYRTKTSRIVFLKIQGSLDDEIKKGFQIDPNPGLESFGFRHYVWGQVWDDDLGS